MSEVKACYPIEEIALSNDNSKVIGANAVSPGQTVKI